jgi:hypothetical protein
MLALVMAAVAPAAAEASLILGLTDMLDGTVKLSYSGFVDLTGISIDSTASNATSLISPSQGRIRTAGAVDIYDTTSSSVAQSFGTGGSVNAVTSSGSAIRVNFSDPTLLGLPSGYTSLSTITGTADYTGSLASLGLTTGTYSFNWGIGGAGRTVTLNVGTVPEPATLSVLALGTVLGGYRYRRRSKLAAAGK